MLDWLESPARRAAWGLMSDLTAGLGGGCAIVALRPIFAEADPAAAGPSILPTQLPTTLNGLIAWLFLFGGSAWCIQKVSELVYAVKAAWRKADAGTDHEGWELCERLRAADQARLKGQADQIDQANALIHDKDAQLAAYAAQVRDLHAQMDELNRRFMDLSMSVSGNNRILVDHVVEQAKAKSSETIPVRVEGTVPVHEVGRPETPPGGAAGA